MTHEDNKEVMMTAEQRDEAARRGHESKVPKVLLLYFEPSCDYRFKKIFRIILFIILSLLSAKNAPADENDNTQHGARQFYRPAAGPKTLPWLVFRADKREPGEVKRAGGFKANYTFYNRQPVYSLYYHAIGFLPQTTPFISTTDDLNVARTMMPASQFFYVYAIRPSSNFISTEGTLGRFNPFPEQREWAALEVIPWEDIVGWYVIANGRAQRTEQNPDYTSPTPISGEIIRPVYSRFDMAGFPESHQALNEEPWRSAGRACIRSEVPLCSRFNEDKNHDANYLSGEVTGKIKCSAGYDSIHDYLFTLKEEAFREDYMNEPAVSAVFSYGQHLFTNKVRAFNKEGYFIDMELPEQGNQGVGASKLIRKGSIINDLQSLSNTVFENGIDAAMLYKLNTKESSRLMVFRANIIAEYDFNEISGEVGKLLNTSQLVVRFPFLKNTIFEKGVDSAFSVAGTDWAYFSKGEHGAFADLKNGELATVNKIKEEWPTIPAGSSLSKGFDAAFCINSPYVYDSPYYVYFFRGRHFLVISFVMNDKGFTVSQTLRGSDSISAFKALRDADW